METVILLGAQGSAPASPVIIDGVPYSIVRVDNNGFVRTVPPMFGISSSAAGSVTAPGAGAAVVTSPSLGTGDYEVQVLAGYGGTADAFNNMRFQVGAAAVGPLYEVAAANGVPVRQVFQLYVSNTTVSVNAIAAGAAGAVYQAVIIWTQVA